MLDTMVDEIFRKQDRNKDGFLSPDETPEHEEEVEEPEDATQQEKQEL